MASRDDVMTAIADYETRFRRADVDKLESSGLYALFPNQVAPGIALVGRWDRDPWPNANRSGVICFSMTPFTGCTLAKHLGATVLEVVSTITFAKTRLTVRVAFVTMGGRDHQLM
jgi:hypothetical protein